jgi:hypothetical protein
MFDKNFYGLAELVMHDERIDRHIHGVDNRLEQVDAEYHRMLNECAVAMKNYKENVFGLETVFVNATTMGRLSVLHDRLIKQRDTFMDGIRLSLRHFRQRVESTMNYLRQADGKFRQSFK